MPDIPALAPNEPGNGDKAVIQFPYHSRFFPICAAPARAARTMPMITNSAVPMPPVSGIMKEGTSGAPIVTTCSKRPISTESPSNTPPMGITEEMTPYSSSPSSHHRMSSACSDPFPCYVTGMIPAFSRNSPPCVLSVNNVIAAPSSRELQRGRHSRPRAAGGPRRPDEEQRDLMHLFFSSIELLPEPRPNGQRVKHVTFRFPIPLDGQPLDRDHDVYYDGDNDNDDPPDGKPPPRGGLPPQGTPGSLSNSDGPVPGIALSDKESSYAGNCVLPEKTDRKMGEKAE